MNIESKDWEIGPLLAGYFFKIPRYQRPYSWERVHVEEFWQDTVQNREEADYFIGSIVAFQDKKDGAYSLVDGQQRFTTIVMMLCALRNAFSENGFPNLAEGAHNVIERRDISNQKQFVLTTESSYPYLQEHILKKGNPELDPNARDEEKALKSSFEFITEKISEQVSSIRNDPAIKEGKKRDQIKRKLETIRKHVLGLKVIFVELDDEDDAYLVFETLNTRGKDLRVSDLVKTHITRLKRPTNRGVDVARDKWTSILRTFEESNANLQVDGFLHHFWLSRHDFVAQKKLFKAIRNTVKKKNIDGFLDDLVRDAKLYRIIHEPSFKRPPWTIEQRGVRDSLDALNHFGVRFSVPFLLTGMREWEEGALTLRQLTTVLNNLENFHFLFNAVTNQRATGGIIMMFASLARQVHEKEGGGKYRACRDLAAKLRDRIPSYEEFKLCFSEIVYTLNVTRQKRLVRYILEKLLKFLGLPIDRESATIEHLLPQSGGSHPDEVVGQLGNLLLVPDKVNAEQLRAKPFAQKLKILNRYKCALDRKIAEANSWGRDEIESRTAWMAELAYKKIWVI